MDGSRLGVRGRTDTNGLDRFTEQATEARVVDGSKPNLVRTRSWPDGGGGRKV